MSESGGWRTFRLDGRVALITGAASGIGRATAELFARAGADLVLGWYRGDPHDVQETVRLVEGHGARAVAVEGDVSRSADVDALVAAALERVGRLDVDVANAGIARRVPTAEVTDDQWDETLGVDLGGVFRCFRAAIPPMAEQGWGRLLAASSVAGTVQSWPEHAHYAASKGGVVGLVRSLAGELGPHGITANAVAPGVVESPQTLDAENSVGAEGLRRLAETAPGGRVGRPEDIAAVYLFLASEEASFISGQLLVADGGMSLSGI
jgi:3-oxoacyl-[acyl-carrier protein] reductase